MNDLMALLVATALMLGAVLFALGYWVGRRQRERDDLFIAAIERMAAVPRLPRLAEHGDPDQPTRVMVRPR